MTAEEVAEILRVPARRVLSLRRRGLLKGVIVPKTERHSTKRNRRDHVVFFEDDVRAFIKAHRDKI